MLVSTGDGVGGTNTVINCNTTGVLSAGGNVSGFTSLINSINGTLSSVNLIVITAVLLPNTGTGRAWCFSQLKPTGFSYGPSASLRSSSGTVGLSLQSSTSNSQAFQTVADSSSLTGTFAVRTTVLQSGSITIMNNQSVTKTATISPEYTMAATDFFVGNSGGGTLVNTPVSPFNPPTKMGGIIVCAGTLSAGELAQAISWVGATVGLAI